MTTSMSLDMVDITRFSIWEHHAFLLLLPLLFSEIGSIDQSKSDWADAAKGLLCNCRSRTEAFLAFVSRVCNLNRVIGISWSREDCARLLSQSAMPNCQRKGPKTLDTKPKPLARWLSGISQSRTRPR